VEADKKEIKTEKKQKQKQSQLFLLSASENYDFSRPQIRPSDFNRY